MERSHMVVKHAHLHAILHLLLENVANLIAYLVVLDDVILNVDIFFGSQQVALEGVELVLSVGENFNRIVGKERRTLNAAHEIYHLLALTLEGVVMNHLL